ncbi:hypothetical protein [Bradyrhizobium sp. SYSU BS000235]|uniref:hypothetical protein n=1 Tax=Bradyrhizobium sp. SYSU BS000235 TaxID=3411332 RepID=UPI003C77E869
MLKALIKLIGLFIKIAVQLLSVGLTLVSNLIAGIHSWVSRPKPKPMRQRRNRRRRQWRST